MKKVAVVVLTTFVGPRPKGKQSAHCNSNPADDRLSNLKWKTPSENYKDKILNGTHFKGSNNPVAKLSDNDVRSIRKMVSKGVPYSQIGKLFGISICTVGRIKRRKLWSHLK